MGTGLQRAVITFLQRYHATPYDPNTATTLALLRTERRIEELEVAIDADSSRDARGRGRKELFDQELRTHEALLRPLQDDWAVTRE